MPNLTLKNLKKQKKKKKKKKNLYVCIYVSNNVYIQ